MQSLGLGLRLGAAAGRLLPFPGDEAVIRLSPNNPSEATSVGTVVEGQWDTGSANHFVEGRMPAAPLYKSDVHLAVRYTDPSNCVRLVYANEGQLSVRCFTKGLDRDIFTDFDYPSAIGGGFIYDGSTDHFRLTDHADGVTVQLIRSGSVLFERANLPFPHDGRPPRTNKVAVLANEDGKAVRGVTYGGARAPVVVTSLERAGSTITVAFTYVGDPQGMTVRVEDATGTVIVSERDLTITSAIQPGVGTGELVADLAGQEGKTLTVVLAHSSDNAKRGSRTLYVPEQGLAATHGMNDSFELAATNLFHHARLVCNITGFTGNSGYRNAHRAPFMESSRAHILAEGDVPLAAFGITNGQMRLAKPFADYIDEQSVAFVIDKAWPDDPTDPLYGLWDIEIPEAWGLIPHQEVGVWERVSGPVVEAGVRKWVFNRIPNPPGGIPPHIKWSGVADNLPAKADQFVRCIKRGSDRSYLLNAEARTATAGLNGYRRYMNDGAINQSYVGEAAAEVLGFPFFARDILPADLPGPDSLFWPTVPIEAYAELCGLDGQGLWMCGHGCYKPETAVAFVAKAKAALPAGHRWGYARSNEIWHAGRDFQQSADTSQRAIAAGREHRHQHCVDSAVHWDAIVSAGLNEDGSGHFIHEWQFSNLQQGRSEVNAVLDYPIPGGGTIRSRLASTGFGNPGFFGGGLYTGDGMATFNSDGSIESRHIDVDDLSAVLDDPVACKTYLMSCLRQAHADYDRPAVNRINAWLQQGNIEKGFAATAVVQSLYEWAAQNFIFVRGQNAQIDVGVYSDRVRELARSPEYGAFFAEVTQFLDDSNIQAVAFASAAPLPFPIRNGLPPGTLINGTFSMADSLASWRTQEPARSYQAKVEELA